MSANVKNVLNQGGELWEVEGELDIKSGGILDIKSGGYLKLNGTDITSALDEMGELAGTPAGASFVIGAEGGQVINVGIQLEDAAGAAIAVRGHVRGYLSDDANGDTPAVTLPNGGMAIGTDGALIGNASQAANAVLVDGNLAISAVPEKFKTTQTLCVTINGISVTKAATDNLVFTAAHIVSATKFGVVLIQINAAGTISTKVPLTPQIYNDAPTALAALPAADAGNVAIGYIAIAADAGDWVANTDDMTNGSDLTTASFNDTAETALNTVPRVFDLISEVDGDIDINITESAADTWYLNLIMPNGKLVTSAAITFA